MRALYVSQTGLTEPLGRSQIVPYLRGLRAAGWEIEVVASEPAGSDEASIRRIRDELAGFGVEYRWLRRSDSHATAVKFREAGAALLGLLVRALKRGPRIIHARSYLPGAVAQAAAMLTPRARFLFDCRGLLGDEYADGGYWPRNSFRYRLLKAWERGLFGRAHGVVTLTEKLRQWLLSNHMLDERTPAEVIPCCVDLERFHADETARTAARERLNAGDRFVLAYAGNLGSWYCEPQMAKLFAAVARRTPALFTVFTRATADRLRLALAEAAVPNSSVLIRSVDPAEMPSMLAAADAAISFAEPWFSKIASSPVKVAEYLACGAPVVVNRGIGDQDDMMSSTDALVDAGTMTDQDLEHAAGVLVAGDRSPAARARARLAARRWFSLDEVGIPRYQRIYERMAG